MAPRVAVFIDYQNAHFTAHERWCPEGAPKHLCLIHPLLLAERLVARRAQGGTLEAVQVFRGKPNSRREPQLASYSDKQAHEWHSDSRVRVHRRELRYPRDFGSPECQEKPQEKGVDVHLAINLVTAAHRSECDAAIVVSHDTDLIPAIQLSAELGLRIEVAAWGSGHRLSDGSIKYCHILSEEDFVAVRDLRDYGVKRRSAALIDPAALMVEPGASRNS